MTVEVASVYGVVAASSIAEVIEFVGAAVVIGGVVTISASVVSVDKTDNDNAKSVAGEDFIEVESVVLTSGKKRS